MMMYHHSIDIAAEASVKEEEDNAKVYSHAVYIRLSLLELRAVEFSSGLQTVVYNEDAHSLERQRGAHFPHFLL